MYVCKYLCMYVSMSVYVCKYECIFLNIYTERERERAREREIHFKELAHTTEGLASPKSARQASRLETQEEVMLYSQAQRQ